MKKTKKELIEKGKFSVVALESNPKYAKMVKKIPKKTHGYNELIKQIKDAFIFGDNEMILELDTFISRNIVKQRTLF